MIGSGSKYSLNIGYPYSSVDALNLEPCQDWTLVHEFSAIVEISRIQAFSQTVKQISSFHGEKLF